MYVEYKSKLLYHSQYNLNEGGFRPILNIKVKQGVMYMYMYLATKTIMH